MKKLLALISLATCCQVAFAFGFADITTWAGSGSKQMALVIDWNDGVDPHSLVWGYRWDGDTTGLAMLESVMATDSRLTRTLGGGGPLTMFGLGYDTYGDGLDLTGSGEFKTPVDPTDHYREGWFEAGFWGYYAATNTSELPDAWGFGDGSFFEGPIQDKDWRGFSFAPGFNGGAPGAPSNPPVPEPATLVALTGLVGVILKRRTRKS